jgi:TldD protein
MARLVHLWYDDEGVPTKKTLLKKMAYVVGLMHNRETAQKFGTEPTGNAREQKLTPRRNPSYACVNTYMAPRNNSFEELFEGCDVRVFL